MSQDYVRRKISRKFNQSVLPNIAAILLEEYRSQNIIKVNYDDPGTIFDKLKELQPTAWVRPDHLKPYLENLILATEENVKTCLHCPSQVGKSTTTLIAIIWALLNKKDYSIFYCTYSDDRTRDCMRTFLYYLDLLNINYVRADTQVSILVDQEQKIYNTVMFTSVGGRATGYKINLFIIDDYVKNGEEVKRISQRMKMWDWFSRVVMTRSGPSGLYSIIIIATRQDNWDLSGMVIDKAGFNYIRIPALCDDPVNDPLNRELGESIWPSAHTEEEYNNRRSIVGDKIFELLYQGNTVANDQKLFSALPNFWTELPKDNWVTIYGMDLAYSTSVRSDFSVCVRARFCKTTGKVYIVDLIREQKLYGDFLPQMERFIRAEPGQVYWYCSSMEEKTVGPELRKVLRSIVLWPTIKKKYDRAQKTAQLWRAGDILFPQKLTSKMGLALNETTEFDADEGAPNDDFVDALVALVDAIFSTWEKIKEGGHRRGKPVQTIPESFVKNKRVDMFRPRSNRSITV